MNKSTAYAIALLGITRQFERTTTFPLDWVSDRIDDNDFNSWLEQELGRKRRLQENKQEIRSKLLEAITRGDNLDTLGEQTQLERRDVLLWIEELSKEGYDMGPYIEAVLQEIPAEEQELAWNAFEIKGDRYLKPILQIVYEPKILQERDIDRLYEWLRMLRMKFRRVHAARAFEAG